MAEKEERITIHKVLYPCKKCSINCNKNDWKDCDFYQNYISGMTRQEAIEKMAKAICQFEMMTERHICKDCSKECFDHLELEVVDKAEAALNALLEADK